MGPYRQSTPTTGSQITQSVSMYLKVAYSVHLHIYRQPCYHSSGRRVRGGCMMIACYCLCVLKLGRHHCPQERGGGSGASRDAGRFEPNQSGAGAEERNCLQCGGCWGLERRRCEWTEYIMCECVCVCVCVSVRAHACVPLWSTDAARSTIQYSVNSWCCQFYSNQCLVLPV